LFSYLYLASLFSFIIARREVNKLKREAKYRYENNIQLLPALKVNIIIVHPRGVVFI
jgi:hypothetical protein